MRTTVAEVPNVFIKQGLEFALWFSSESLVLRERKSEIKLRNYAVNKTVNGTERDYLLYS